MTNHIPARARTADLIVEHLGDETLVFDRRDDTAHCLSTVAAQIWERCDGETTARQLVEMLTAAGEPDAELLVERALADLTERGLLVEDGVSRRSAIARMAKVGAGALSVPLVLSVAAPTAAWAGSVITGGVCTSSGSSDGGCASPQDICTNGTGGNATRYCVNKQYSNTCIGSTGSFAGCTGANVPNTGCCSGYCSTTAGKCA